MVASRDNSSRIRLTERLDTAWAPCALSALVGLLFIFVQLSLHEWDPSYFIMAGEQYCDVRAAPSNLALHGGTVGYDGQFFYRLALDPFDTEEVSNGIRLDYPGYRHQRVLYPLLAWVLSLGKSELAPASLIMVNFLALVAAGWLGGAYAAANGRHALWGGLFALSPGFVVSLARDLSEVLMGCLVLGALLLLHRRRYAVAAIVLSLAVLTRETALAAAVGILGGLWLEARRERRRVGPAILVLPVGVFALWQAILAQQYGTMPVLTRGDNFGAPFVGFLATMAAHVSVTSPYGVLLLAELIAIAVLAALVLVALRTSRAPSYVKVCWLLYAGMAVMMSTRVWEEDWAFLRALVEFHTFTLAVFMTTKSHLRHAGFAVMAFLWLMVYAHRLELHHLVL